MAISKNTTIFNVDGRRMQFNSLVFNEQISLYKKKSQKTNNEIIGVIANKSGVSEDAVRNWKKGNNGPSEIKMIEDIADVLQIGEYKLFLKEIKEENVVEKLTDRQLTAVKKIYDSIVTFMNEFINSNGFNSYQTDIIDKMKIKEYTAVEYINGYDSSDGYMVREVWNLDDIDKPNEKMLNVLEAIIESKMGEIELSYKKEYFDLKNTDIYEELGQLIYDWEEGIRACVGNDKADKYKLSSNYRWDAWEEWAEEATFHTNKRLSTTTEEDYHLIMNKLNGIIDKYIE